KWASDWFLNLAVAFRRGLCFIPESIALFRIVPTSYSRTGFGNRASLIEVIHCAFDMLRSPAYYDLVPFFHKTGAMGQFGSELLYGAAARPDGWGSHIMPLISCLHTTEYQTLLNDENPQVRELASFFVRMPGPRDTQIHNLEETPRDTRQELQRAQNV